MPAVTCGQVAIDGGADHVVVGSVDDHPVVVEVRVDGGGDVAVAQLGEGVLLPPSRWRRLMRSSLTVGEWAAAWAKPPPAPTSGSWWWSPTSTTRPPAATCRVTACSSVRMSAMPASSMTSRVPPPGRSWPVSQRRMRDWRVRDGMAAPASSSIAARADGAAPTTSKPAAFEGGANGVEGEGLAGAGGADQHATGVTLEAMVGHGGGLVVAEGRSISDRVAERTRSADGGIGVGSRDGGDEALLDVGEFAAGPRLGLVVRCGRRSGVVRRCSG